MNLKVTNYFKNKNSEENFTLKGNIKSPISKNVKLNKIKVKENKTEREDDLSTTISASEIKIRQNLKRKSETSPECKLSKSKKKIVVKYRYDLTKFCNLFKRKEK